MIDNKNYFSNRITSEKPLDKEKEKDKEKYSTTEGVTYILFILNLYDIVRTTIR